jgi:hypothetical protein
MNKEIIKKILIKRNIDIVITAIAILMGAYFGWTIPQMLIFGIFVWAILNPISSRIPAIVALAFLSFTPFLLAFQDSKVVMAITSLFLPIKGTKLNGSALAEETAIYAYYFLILTVIMAIYEIRKEDKEDNKENKKDKQKSLNFV